MSFTITVPLKNIKAAILNTLDSCVYEQYDAEVLKAANVPPRKTVLDKILADEKTMQKLQKNAAESIEGYIDDYLYDAMMDLNMPELDKMVNACEAACDAIDLTEANARKENTIKLAIKTLKSAGYKVTK